MTSPVEYVVDRATRRIVPYREGAGRYERAAVDVARDEVKSRLIAAIPGGGVAHMGAAVLMGAQAVGRAIIKRGAGRAVGRAAAKILGRRAAKTAVKIATSGAAKTVGGIIAAGAAGTAIDRAVGGGAVEQVPPIMVNGTVMDPGGTVAGGADVGVMLPNGLEWHRGHMYARSASGRRIRVRFDQRTGMIVPARKSMNVLNPRALRRARSRMEGFHRVATQAVKDIERWARSTKRHTRTATAKKRGGKK